MSAPLFEGIDHVAIAVSDTDTALRYYTEVLRLRVVHDEIADDPGVRLTYLDGGGTYLQLVQPVRNGPVSDFIAERGEGLHHICFLAASIADAVQQMPGESDARVFLGGRGRRACFLLHSPENVRIELTETDPIS